MLFRSYEAQLRAAPGFLRAQVLLKGDAVQAADLAEEVDLIRRETNSGFVEADRLAPRTAARAHVPGLRPGLVR